MWISPRKDKADYPGRSCQCYSERHRRTESPMKTEKENTMRTLLRNTLALAVFAMGSVMMPATVNAQTNKLIIESGDSAQSRQDAAMDKEQWNDTRSLRQKVNQRAEKEWDKADTAFDGRDNCLQSSNVNAYWEPNTRRCLDRSTGRVIRP